MPKYTHARRALIAGTAAALGLTAFAAAAPPAGAATSSQWDKVAECESGGDWSINTGNGFYGGVQFDRQTWDRYGGSAYSATADKASRSQQISVAEKVLKTQGKGAWPNCGSGLTSDSGSSGSSGSTAPAPTNVRTVQASAPKVVHHHTVHHHSTKAAPRIARGTAYTVEKGDTLRTIAVRAGLPQGWAQLYPTNHAVLRANGNGIKVGQVLHIPAQPRALTVT